MANSFSSSFPRPFVVFLFVLLLAAFSGSAQVTGGGSTGFAAAAPHLGPFERAATHLAFDEGGAAPRRSMAALAIGEQPRSDTRSSDLSLEGNIGYVISGDRTSLELKADRVANNRSGGVSGSLRLTLWATTTAPSFGSGFSGYRLGYYPFTSTLNAGFYFSDIDRFVSFTSPPNGTYYVTMTLDEYSSSNDQTVNNGFGYHDLQVFSNQLVLGSTSNPATVVDHTITSSVDATSFLPNDRVTSFSASAPVAHSWIKLNPFLGPHTLQWRFYAPDGSVYQDSGSMSRTGTAGFAYYAYYVSLNIAGTGAAARPGLWRANVLIDGVTVVNDTFTIVALPVVNSCTPNSSTLCLLNNRFKVTLSVSDPRVSGNGAANATPQGDWGYFDVPAATGSTDKPVIFVKLIDGRPVNQKYWVFYGGLTDLQYTFVVTDTVTGAVKSYTKQTGTYDGKADTSAFAGN